MTRTPGLTGIAFVAFVSLGLPDGVLGVAWPSMRETLGLGMGELGGLLAAAMVGYVVSAFASGALTARLGLGGLLLASSVVMVTSSLGYAMASGRRASLAAALLAGLGGGAIDAGINAYAARRLSARLATWLHACYGVGAAGIAASAYWASLTLGRVAFGALAVRHPPARLLRVSLVGASAAALILWLAPQPILGFLGLAALGFAFAPVYPLLVTMTPDRVGRRHVTHALGVHVAVAYLGAAALPGAAGALASTIGLHAVAPFLFAGIVVFTLLYHAPMRAVESASGPRALDLRAGTHRCAD